MSGRTRPLTSKALHSFAFDGWSPPYTATIYDHQIAVFRVRPKLGIAASRQVMLAHAVLDAAGVLIRGKITYSARWACDPRHGVLNAIFLDEAQATGKMCHYCFPRIPDAGDCLYRIYDKSGHLVYIGSTDSIGERIAVHRRIAKWRDRIADVRTTTYPTLPAARAAEVAAIKAEHPECNILHGEAART